MLWVWGMCLQTWGYYRYGSCIWGSNYLSSVIEWDTRLFLSCDLDHQPRGHGASACGTSVGHWYVSINLGCQLSARSVIIYGSKRHRLQILLCSSTWNLAWYGCKGCAFKPEVIVYMDHASGVSAITLASWNERRHFSFRVISIISQWGHGPSACGTSLVRWYGSINLGCQSSNQSSIIYVSERHSL